MRFDNNNFSGISSARPASTRGFVPLYHSDSVNHCPGCGHTHWHIGRAMAECAFCETALPLAASSAQPMEPLFFHRGTTTAMAA